MTHREQAEELRLALAMGLVEKTDVIRWADTVIEAEAIPAAWVLDISLSANESKDTVSARLRHVVDGIDVTVPTRRALDRVAQRFRSGQLSPLDAARMLATWANQARVSARVLGHALEVKFIAEDVAEGHYGSLSDVTRAIDRFLASHETAGDAG